MQDQEGIIENALVAKASTTIKASVARVWRALITPEEIKRYMFGATVVSDWKVGGPIVWKGEWKGKQFEDKGRILRIEPERLLSYSHFSPLSGLPEKPENFHTVTIELADQGGRTLVTLTQDNNRNEEERAHSEENWRGMLEGLKKMLEERGH